MHGATMRIVCVYFDVLICHDIPLHFFRLGNYEMEEKENLTAAQCLRFRIMEGGKRTA